jgi:tagatose 6-phosphate kinase
VIVTVTLNPALHVTYETERLAAGQSNPVSRVGYRAGGRGLAVARTLHRFGHEVLAAGLAGGASGELIRTELARSGVATQFTMIGRESRRVLEVASADGTVTSFAEPAPYITTEELGRLAADYRRLMNGAAVAVLCGSLPDGLPPETYATLASYAAEAGVAVVLDAGGGALRRGASRRPALVIPELPARQADPPRSAAGSDLSRAAAWSDAGSDLSRAAAWSDAGSGLQRAAASPDLPDPAALLASGAAAVALPVGDSVRALTSTGEWRARLQGRPAPQAPHSRDALVAGLVPGVALGWSWPDALRHAVALAAAALPSGEIDLDAYERLLSEVRITSPRSRGSGPAARPATRSSASRGRRRR